MPSIKTKGATRQKAFRLPTEIAEELERRGQGNATEYVIEALKAKFDADERERFRASFARIAALPAEERDVEWAFYAQSEVALRD